ncbi:AAA-type ATPase (CDC48 subfamily) [Natronomonas pharaonis DSM 2160]|uniref:AAA-type ATPase (CDC48 subfamily) n=1 Tax=Natronomonas pharaonis (strain ATCC 35678 / DSM 2160 / CIP 103997 / JCM 8858 / NBRC 14720 / NCIMB 2260 / Gabara) TaxID=348780 RepID=A0A1U7EY92_NATPD|nr:AAA family ATPase [Natronomonas pharaonis]CAI50183.1 AAA-type ATPase (CDC48 subfamily) [Natronomonas pharaonis DSM 2160]
MDRQVTLTVKGAEKRDAGRGVARLPEAARQQLGVLSGDTVVIDGESPTVAKVWPGTGGGETVRIDAETRANAGVTIGDTVTVEPVSIADADRVVVELPVSADDDLLEAVATDLQDRPLRDGEAVRLERPGVRARVVETDPGGTVRVTGETTIRVRESPDASDGITDSAPEQTETAERAAPEPTPDATYEDIGGLDEELEQVREMIELPLSEPELFRKLGIEPPSGVLLYGPPGTGKTLIAKAVANEVDAHFEVIDGPEIVSKYKGESEERLRETFERAVDNQPAVVFIDEIDSIAGTRDEDADMENRVVAQLLTLMDGLENHGRLIVIGATNRVDAIDPALRRGGRFDREIEIGAPDEGGRREILDVHTRGMPLSEDVDIDYLAARTHGFVGADIHSLATEAAMEALRSRDERGELRVTAGDFEAALTATDPSAMREYVAETPEAAFEDVGGLDAAKQRLTEAVEWPLSYGPLFEETNTDPPTGILLYGPPGTGKTLLARALAGESDVNFVSVAGPELLDKYVGESEKAVREVFDRARQAAPAIVFFDEIDALAGVRGDASEATERVVSQLLAELDGLADNPNMVVLAATNRKAALDPALLRPGRLETHVEVPDPGETARKEILDVHTRGKPLGEDVDLDEVAAETAGRSGAELEAVVRDASMRAIRELATELGPEAAADRADEVTIERRHFEAALDAIETA